MTNSKGKLKATGSSKPKPNCQNANLLLGLSPLKILLVPSMNIDDLNDDCLIQIFSHLNFHHLLSVADSNGWLRPAAAYAYKRSYGDKMIQISHVEEEKQIQFSTSKLWSDRIDLRNLRFCLQFLRCLGSGIERIAIDYNESTNEVYEHVHHYINAYCSGSLKEIKFWGKPAKPIRHFVQPFVNVENVSVWCGNLDEQLPKFVEWFPNLRRLELRDVHLNHRLTAINFQHLEQLYIEDCTKCGLASKCMINLLHSNQQLKSLQIKAAPFGMTLDKLLDVIGENNKLMTKFSFTHLFGSISGVFFVDSILMQGFINKCPLLDELNLPCHHFTSNDIITLIQHLKSLKLFNCYMERSEFCVLESQLGKHWCSSFEANFVTLRRN